MNEQYPTRFEHAAILTEDPANPTADTMVVEGEKIAWVGRAKDLPACYAGDACTAVDLAGARLARRQGNRALQLWPKLCKQLQKRILPDAGWAGEQNQFSAAHSPPPASEPSELNRVKIVSVCK